MPAPAALPPAPEIHEFDWHDGVRGRAVPVRLVLPRESAAAAPLLVVSHGIGGSRRGYRWLGEHLAARGMASLHLQHVGSDRSLWGGNPLSLLLRLHDAADEAEALHRVQDLRFALDRLLAGPLAARVDAARIVGAGHSYGANTMMLAIGAQVQRGGRPLDLRDERLRAAILISAPPFYGEGDPAPILSALRVPCLHVTATEDVIRIPGYHSGPEDRVALYQATGSAQKWLAVFEGGSHSVFTDRMASGGVQLNARVKAATQQLVQAFVQQALHGDGGALRDWPQQHAALLARFEAPAAGAHTAAVAPPRGAPPGQPARLTTA